MKIPVVSNILLYCPEEESVFLLKRSEEVDSPGIWGLPGGHVEDGESFRQAAIREAHEEVGGLPSIKELSEELFNKENNKIIIYVCSVKLDEKKSWKPKLNSESSDFGWFSIDSIPPNTFDTIKSIIKKLPSLKRTAVYSSILRKPKRF